MIKRISLFSLIIFFCAVSTGRLSEQTYEGLIVKDGYEYGIGTSVGTVQLVQGTALIVHAGDSFGYFAKKDLPLFKGDTVITRDDGRISFRLNDGSILTLTSGTKLVINESVYDADKENRSSFVSMAIGKARFWVKSLTDFKRSEFKVKTQTAVVGVRGSDFIVEADENHTNVTALENTRVEVVSLFVPCEKQADKSEKCKAEPVTLTDFERATVRENALPSRPEEILPEERNLLKKEFTVSPADEKAGVKKDASSEQRDVYLVPKDVLVSPETLSEVRKIEATATPDISQRAAGIIRQEENNRQEAAVLQHQDKSAEVIIQTTTETVKPLSVLPGFPNEPKK